MFRLLLTCIFTGCYFVGWTQLQVQVQRDYDSLIRHFFVGEGMAVDNIKYKGNAEAFGLFRSDSGVFHLDSGIVLTTGKVDNCLGPNNKPDASGINFNRRDKKRSGDRDLNRVCKSKTFDAAVIEFDFIPFNNKITFNYFFASEEYTEYVGSRFNDVFAFLIQGPKVKRRTNLAVVGENKDPVSINTINHKTNKSFYINNNCFREKLNKPPAKRTFWEKLSFWKNKGGLSNRKLKKLSSLRVKSVQFDGLTTRLTASCHVVPYKKYHIKIAIADVGDQIFDSGVFVEAYSFSSIKDTAHKAYKPYADLSENLNLDSIFGKYTPEEIVEEEPPKVVIEEAFEVTDVHFDSDLYQIPDSSMTKLKLLAAYLKKEKTLKCELYGYTDNKGSKRYNQKLSEKRANAVREFLVAQGIAPSRIQDEGLNFERPIASNATAEGRWYNRRVEIVLVE